MATEDELPVELDKLEIAPILPQAQLLDENLAVQLNPFFENDIKANNTKSKDKPTLETTDIIQPTKFFNAHKNLKRNLNCRRCRHRRASESVLDELKNASSNTALDLTECLRNPPEGLLKQTLKKSTISTVGGSSNRKVLLREPVLKALQICFHPLGGVRRKLLAAAAAKTRATISDDGPLTAKGMSDFRDLIDECSNLLAKDVDFRGRLNQISLTNRNSKNFTTLQTPKIQSTKLRNIRRPTVNTATLKVSSSEIPTMRAMPSLQPSLLNPTITSTNLQQRNLSTEHTSNNSRCRTTCSQQAGNSSAVVVCDDVSIDELASYFDTFVHIPKNMSSMAEMMYI